MSVTHQLESKHSLVKSNHGKDDLSTSRGTSCAQEEDGTFPLDWTVYVSTFVDVHEAPISRFLVLVM
jgi:hypothetical protein